MKISKKSLLLLGLAALLLVFTSCSDSDTDNEDEMVNVITNDIEGFYTGSLSADVGSSNASIIIRPSDSNLFCGEYFGTNDFTACCNEEGSDGTIMFVVDSSNSNLSDVEINFDSASPNCTATLLGDGDIFTRDGAIVFRFNLIQNGCSFRDLETTLRLTKVRNFDQ